VIAYQSDGERVTGYATDGSMGGDGRSVDNGMKRISAASVTKCGKTMALVHGGEALAMHGEILGIIMALREAKLRGTATIEIHSDYLNAVKKLTLHSEGLDIATKLQNGKSWFGWIVSTWDELKSKGITPTIHQGPHEDHRQLNRNTETQPKSEHRSQGGTNNTNSKLGSLADIQTRRLCGIHRGLGIRIRRTILV
jgi:hypothetical protein